MASSENQQDPPSARARRPSLTELFASRPPTNRPQPTAMSAAMAQQAQEASRSRRLSITTLGLSGSSPKQVGQQTSPFGTLRRGTGAADDATTCPATDENAVDEDDAVGPIGDGRATGTNGSQMMRRLSLGARAYGGTRSSSLSYPGGGSPGGGGNSVTSAAGISPPSMKKEGFNFSENMRSRAERASISGQGGGGPGHARSKSTALENTAPAPAPPPVQKPKPKPNVPDHFQERILKGDFYMD